MSPASVAAEAWVLTRLSPPCPTAGCMVCLPTLILLLIITSELTVVNDRSVRKYLVSWKSPGCWVLTWLSPTGGYD